MAKGSPRRLGDGAEVRMELLAEEQGVERDGFSGFEADKAYANGSAQAAEAALNASGDFSDNVDHDVLFFVGWMTAVRTLGTVPTEK